MFILMDVPVWSNFCLYSNSCLQAAVIRSSQRLRYFRIFSPKYFFFEVAVRLQQLPTKNMKWEVKSFDLARARNTSQAGARSSPRGLFYQKKLISVSVVQSLGLLFVWRKTDLEWISLTDGLLSMALSLTLGMMLTAHELNAASAALGNFL